MHTRMASRIKLGLVGALVSAATLVACLSVSGSVKGRYEHGDKKFEGTATATVNTYNQDNPTDKCFDLKFFDANGNVTGSGEIHPGRNSGTIPPGSETYKATEKPCRESGGGLVGSGGGVADLFIDVQSGGPQTGIGGVSARRPLPTTGLLVWGGPLGFNLNSPEDNAMFEFEVLTTSPDEATALAQEALALPIGSPIDGRIRIVSWFRAVQSLSVGKVIGLARSPFTQFSMDVNGTPAYADLATGTNVVQSQLPHGIWMVESNVSLFDINGFDTWNTLAIRHQNAGAVPYSLRAEMLHGSP